MGIFDWKHWIVLLIVVVLVFGTKKLKNLGGDLGESIKGFRKAMSDEEHKPDETTVAPSQPVQPAQSAQVVVPPAQPSVNAAPPVHPAPVAQPQPAPVAQPVPQPAPVTPAPAVDGQVPPVYDPLRKD